MLQSQRSLASYFDGQPAEPRSSSWYEQTQLQGAHLNDWTKNAEGKKEFFYPHGSNPNDVPADKTRHAYGKKWKDGQWGYNPSIAAKNKEKREARSAKNKERSMHVKKEHDAALKLFMENRAWEDTRHQTKIVDTMATLEDLLTKLKQMRDNHKTDVMGRQEYIIREHDSSETAGQKKRDRNYAIYDYLIRTDNIDWPSVLSSVSHYLAANPSSFDKYGTYLPQHAPNSPGYHHIAVLSTYLRAIKHEILSAAVHKLKANESATAKKFVEHSHNAQKELAPLLRKRKHVKVPKWRPDKVQLDALYKHLGERDLAMFKFLNPGKPIPKHLQRYEEGYQYVPPKKGDGRRKGKQEGGGQAQPAQPGQGRQRAGKGKNGNGRTPADGHGHAPAAASRLGFSARRSYYDY
jgi:hypothetical protein